MKLLLMIFFASVLKTISYGQCPPHDSLWHRILFLRDSSRVPLKDQQVELEGIVPLMKDCAYKNDSTHALLLGRIGGLCFLQGEYVKGIEYLKQSNDIIYRNLDKPNTSPALLIRNYNNLRLCYDSLGQKNLRRAAIDSCISCSVRLNQGYRYSLGLMYGKTLSYIESGDYYGCINYTTFAENVCRDAGMGMDTITDFISWRVNALVFLKKYEEAEKLATKYLNICLKDSALKNPGSFYGLLGTISKETGRTKDALDFYNKSLIYYQRAKITLGYATTLSNMGDLYLRNLKSPDEAIKYYQRAFTYAKSDNSVNRIGEGMNMLNNIAQVYMEKKDYDKAFTYFQRSFDEIHPGIDENDLAKTSDKFLSAELADFVISLALNKADAHLGLYEISKDKDQLSKAINTYKTINRLVDRIKFGQTDLESKLFWRSRMRRLYENAIKASYLQNNPADAFYFFEKGRAALLQDQLNEQRVLRSDEVMQQTQQVRVINRIEQQLNDSISTAVRDSLQRQVLKNKQELERLRASIKENNGFYYQSVLDSSSPTIADVRDKILRDHEALVEIFAGDSAVYTLVITKDKVQLKKIDKPVYDSLSNSFIKYLSNNELINQKFGDFFSTASQLYQLIFSDTPLPEGRIIVSPDGKCFPFEALVITKSVMNPVYFVEKYAVSYTYSARYLFNSFETNRNVSNRNFMGMAPVKFSSALDLPNLIGSDVSLARIESHFGKSDNWMHEQASKNNFLQNFYRYKLIQLYSHATDSGFRKEPVIYFADSALLLSDLLYENKPVTSLIVLSACETGAGKVYEGEGVFGFNRGFAAVGIPSSIANLWQVENTSTYQLNELFYANLAKGMPLDIALQEAKKEFIKTASGEKQLPFYWAAPILTGRTDAIELKKNYAWIFIAAAVCLIAFVVVMLVVWRNRKEQYSQQMS